MGGKKVWEYGSVEVWNSKFLTRFTNYNYKILLP
jgi:hypothetical protein